MPYTCCDCGTVFLRPKTWFEPLGPDQTMYKLSGCPECGGTFSKTIYCNFCEEPITDYYIELKDGHTYCSNCFINKQFGE